MMRDGSQARGKMPAFKICFFFAMTGNPTPKSFRDDVLDSLVASFPVFRDAQPLAIGIHKKILERMPELTKAQVGRALKIHTGSTRYLKVLSNAEQRFDLDGNPAGEVTAEQRDAATKLVKDRFKKAAERRKAEEQTKQHQAKLQQLAEKFNSR
ncbi:MAG TPA: ProQ/FINO family protein [Parasulfuritortus sp.]